MRAPARPSEMELGSPSLRGLSRSPDPIEPAYHAIRRSSAVGRHPCLKPRVAGLIDTDRHIKHLPPPPHLRPILGWAKQGEPVHQNALGHGLALRIR